MKKLRLLLSFLFLLSLACLSASALGEGTIPTIITIVPAPEQTEPQRPACFPDPADNYIPLPDTENLAEGKEVHAGQHNDVYVNSNVNDGKTDTYWESKGFPAEMTILLSESRTVSTVAVCLNPSSIWDHAPRKLPCGSAWTESTSPKLRRRKNTISMPKQITASALISMRYKRLM